MLYRVSRKKRVVNKTSARERSDRTHSQTFDTASKTISIHTTVIQNLHKKISIRGNRQCKERSGMNINTQTIVIVADFVVHALVQRRIRWRPIRRHSSNVIRLRLIMHGTDQSYDENRYEREIDFVHRFPFRIWFPSVFLFYRGMFRSDQR